MRNQITFQDTKTLDSFRKCYAAQIFEITAFSLTCNLIWENIKANTKNTQPKPEQNRVRYDLLVQEVWKIGVEESGVVNSAPCLTQ